MSVCVSVSPRGVNLFKTLRLRDCWANVDETWHVYSMGLETKLLGSGILNFGPCAALGHPELSQVGRDDPARAGCLCKLFVIYSPQRYIIHGSSFERV